MKKKVDGPTNRREFLRDCARLAALTALGAGAVLAAIRNAPEGGPCDGPAACAGCPHRRRCGPGNPRSASNARKRRDGPSRSRENEHGRIG